MEVSVCVKESILYIVQFFGYRGRMSCYLKVSYAGRHRKYRYAKDRPLNFHQIRQELQVPLHLHPSLLQLASQHHEHAHIPMTEQQFVDYLKSAPLDEKETIRVRIVEPKLKPEDAPSHLDRIKSDHPESRSQEVRMETAVFSLRTESLEVTQQFLCNSTMERIERPSSEDIRLELERNLARQGELKRMMKLRDLPALYSQLQRTAQDH